MAKGKGIAGTLSRKLAPRVNYQHHQVYSNVPEDKLIGTVSHGRKLPHLLLLYSLLLLQLALPVSPYFIILGSPSLSLCHHLFHCLANLISHSMCTNWTCIFSVLFSPTKPHTHVIR
ncbi:hypothetical protein, unlikely [Trypanosoma brucei brucei TREU927]|uniref:Uncharacterized protein n=1 Tax=Trypanosoma brucei brucei (strain 927/4 GUTat10.1) TaxID=185431 RepID=Q4GYQ2_TRYB2|nr:hypothetical protein, unlikely [Trypanosoma brucei brucei TREU927]CAJ16532.1 hypothetical protein, unlikely [Trypanosoma brucei brucei TREU927]